MPDMAEVRYNVRDEVPTHCDGKYLLYGPDGVCRRDGIMTVNRREGFVWEAREVGIWKVCFHLSCDRSQRAPRRITLDVAVDGQRTANSGIDGIFDPSDMSNVVAVDVFDSFVNGIQTVLQEIHALELRQSKLQRLVDSAHWRILVATGINALAVAICAWWQLRALTALLVLKKVV